MNHTEAIVLIPELLQGALPEREQSELRLHADQCGDCQASIDSYNLLQAAIAQAAKHPSDEAIVQFALERAKLSAAELTHVESHVAGCAGCRAACEAIIAAEREALQGNVVTFPSTTGAAASSRTPVRTTSWRQLAAASVLLVVGIAAGKWWFGARADGSGAWSGIAAMPMIGETLRDGSSTLTLRVRSGQALISAALVATIPAELAPHDRLRVVIESTSGNPAWSTELTAAEFRLLSEGSGALALLIPSADIPAGTDHRLRLISLRDRRDLLVVPIRVVLEETQ